MSVACGVSRVAGWWVFRWHAAFAGLSISNGFSAVRPAVASVAGCAAGAAGGSSMVRSGGCADGWCVAARLFSGAQSESCGEYDGGAFRFGCAVLSAGAVYWLLSVERISGACTAADVVGNPPRLRTQSRVAVWFVLDWLSDAGFFDCCDQAAQLYHSGVSRDCADCGQLSGPGAAWRGASRVAVAAGSVWNGSDCGLAAGAGTAGGRAAVSAWPALAESAPCASGVDVGVCSAAVAD